MFLKANQYTVTEKQVPVDGGEIVVRCYAPTGDDTYPILVWYHGGGLLLDYKRQASNDTVDQGG